MSIEKYTAYTGMLHFYGVYKHHEILYMNCVVGDVAPAVNTCKAIHFRFYYVYPRSAFFYSLCAPGT